MGRTAPLDAPTLAWAKERFALYYRDAAIAAPVRLPRREIAAFPFAAETLMRRHAAVETEAGLRAFLAREVPRHVYYSSAYYARPAEPTMAGKEWLGADLVFDLDADHLRGAGSKSYAEQLELVRERLLTLVDDFLFGDFGVDPGTTDLVFSGGRGYHVHVRDERFLGLSSPERRELVDYVHGIGFDPLRTVEDHREDVREGRTLADAEDDETPSRPKRRLPLVKRLAPPEAPGWRGRTTRAVLAVLGRWERADPGIAVSEMVGWGIDRAEARRFAKELLEGGGAAKIRETLSLDVFRKGSATEFLRAIVPHAAVEVQGETDAPVTTDIHRLIRLPGSLHGGTGFRVLPLEREGLERFDPFRSAPIPLADGDRTEVTLTEPVDYPFDGTPVRGEAGASLELPTSRALFLVLRGEAVLRP